MLVYGGFDAKGKRVIIAALEPKDMVLLRAGQKIAFDTSARAPEFPPIGVILDYTEHPEKYRAAIEAGGTLKTLFKRRQ
jgi:hypothetical protein